ncbi:hypothetical protein SBOR_4639 [Sclerotinia borealis F-4128]|uniref:Uncharacterized protein n=1 Tax=Sclerotinia borealis (strain F-4128) TaxID=1432307 RepID=W9CGF7_SCLBF|nr:hypothetical protein SBOR_4639 [Sclerotinia borealis F-4128]
MKLKFKAISNQSSGYATPISMPSPHSDMPTSARSSVFPNISLQSDQSQSPATPRSSRSISASNRSKSPEQSRVSDSSESPEHSAADIKVRRWTSAEYRTLMAACSQGMEMPTIQETHFPHLTISSCWTHFEDPKFRELFSDEQWEDMRSRIDSLPWAWADDQILMIMFSKNNMGLYCIRDVYFPQRSIDAVRNRFIHLDSMDNVNPGTGTTGRVLLPWSCADDQILMAMRYKHGMEWATIRHNYFPHRSIDALRTCLVHLDLDSMGNAAK